MVTWLPPQSCGKKIYPPGPVLYANAKIGSTTHGAVYSVAMGSINFNAPFTHPTVTLLARFMYTGIILLLRVGDHFEITEGNNTIGIATVMGYDHSR